MKLDGPRLQFGNRGVLRLSRIRSSKVFFLIVHYLLDNIYVFILS